MAKNNKKSLRQWFFNQKPVEKLTVDMFEQLSQLNSKFSNFGSYRTRDYRQNNLDWAERAYHVLATHFSMASISITKSKIETDQIQLPTNEVDPETGEIIYETVEQDYETFDYVTIKEDPLAFLLTKRPNDLQTPTAFLYAFFYQLFKYGNAIAVPTYKVIEKGGRKEYEIASIEILDCGLYKFGYGYTSIEGSKYLIAYSSVGEEEILIPYRDVIHLRLNPHSYFAGEYGGCIDLGLIPDILNTNLSSNLSELENNFKLKGVFKLGSSSVDDISRVLVGNADKEVKTEELLSRIQEDIIVLDAGEEFKELITDYKKSDTKYINDLMDIYFGFIGVSPSIIQGNWTYEEFTTFYISTLQPKLKDFYEEINYKLLSKNKITRGYEIRVNLSKLSGANLKDMTNFFASGRYHGYLTVNEIRNYIGEKPVKGGNIFTGNLNMSDMNNFQQVNTVNDSSSADGVNGDGGYN